jgi:hypothetical protein
MAARDRAPAMLMLPLYCNVVVWAVAQDPGCAPQSHKASANVGSSPAVAADPNKVLRGQDAEAAG